MGSEARPSRLEFESTASTSSTRGSSSLGDTRFASSATSAGSYELHVLHEKARSSIAPAETSPDDGVNESKHPPALSHPPDKREMSRAPLLVRSSPAQGTGSYGGLPVLALASSPDDSDDHHVTSFLPRSKERGKGKSKLRHSEPTQSRTSLNRSHDDSIRSEPVYTSSRARRRSTKDGSSGSRTLDEALEGQEEFGLESRFTASSVAPTATGAPRIFESLRSSSGSDQIDESDDEETSDSNDLHDVKTNGHPADNSPYAQVRASVAATDDITLSINTPRMWTLSILFAILGSSTNLFFSLRYPSVSITPIIALLLVHPLGLLWDQVLKRASDPDETFLNGAIRSDSSIYANRYEPPTSQFKDTWRRRLRLWLAQGRWNEKEHCCVYISSNVSFGFAFATDVSIRPNVLEATRANIDIGHRRTNKVLPSRSRSRLPDPPHPVYSNPGLCTCWYYSPISCAA